MVIAILHSNGKDGVCVDPTTVNKEGDNALMCAAKNGHAEISAILLAATDNYGAVPEVNRANKKNGTALFGAVGQRSLRIVQLLLERDATVDERTFDFAVHCNGADSELVRRLEQKIAMKSCAACKADKPVFKFAKAQLKKAGADRKCAACVLTAKTKAQPGPSTLLRCSSCEVEKASAQFSKAQRGKKEARKCSDCIAQGDAKQKEAKATMLAAQLIEAEAASSAQTTKQKQKQKQKKSGGKKSPSVTEQLSLAKAGKEREARKSAARVLESAEAAGDAAVPVATETASEREEREKEERLILEEAFRAFRDRDAGNTAGGEEEEEDDDYDDGDDDDADGDDDDGDDE